jgi:hypothetical protein
MVTLPVDRCDAGAYKEIGMERRMRYLIIAGSHMKGMLMGLLSTWESVQTLEHHKPGYIKERLEKILEEYERICNEYTTDIR